MPLPLQHFSPAHSPHGRGGISSCFAALSAALLPGHPPPHSSTTSARLGAAAERTGLAAVPIGTCWFCYAREEPDASPVFVSKIWLQGRARNTGLSTVLAYASAGVHQPPFSTLQAQCWHPRCLQPPSHLVFPVPHSAAHALWL